MSTPTKITALVDNLWTRSTTVVTASSEALTLPAANTQNKRRRSVWRSDGTQTEDWIQADFGTAKPFNCLGLANAVTNGVRGFDLRVSDDGSSWTDIAGIPDQHPKTKVAALFFDAVTKRYAAIRATGPSAIISEIGIVGIGMAATPTYQVESEVPTDPKDPSILREAVDGNRAVALRTVYRKLDFPFKLVAEADLLFFRGLYETAGMGKPFFLFLDPSARVSSDGWMQWLLFFNAPPSEVFVKGRGIYHVTLPCQEAR